MTRTSRARSPIAEHRFSATYRLAMALVTPIVAWWGRLEVHGLEHLPRRGGVILAGNHDSHWDPLAVGVAARSHRPISALAKASMWRRFGLRQLLDGMRQIPIHRGAGDAEALRTAVERLRDGACIGMFPEGTLSHGEVLRARSGVGRLAQAVPEATVVAFAVHGTVDIVRFPKRPRISVTFFPPALDDATAEAGQLAERLLAEVRSIVPPVVAGRNPGRRKVPA